MNVQLEPGLYVVAVSGGVDSMVLLDTIRQLPEVRVIVAHYDHGIRDDSPEDRRLVEATARQHRLPFVYDRGELGPDASEALARSARYHFLHHVREVGGARAIVTAHHQDDVLETAILNMLRGTGRKGLTALGETNIVKRPLLRIPKYELADYAHRRQLLWREDSTNRDDRYLRNYVRHNIVPRLGVEGKRQLLELVESMRDQNQTIDALLGNYMQQQPAENVLDRTAFVMLPHPVAKEVLAHWLREYGLRGFDAQTIERLVIRAKTSQAGAKIDASHGYVLHIGKRTLALQTNER